MKNLCSDEELHTNLVRLADEMLTAFQVCGYLDKNDENFRGTPERVARMWGEIFSNTRTFDQDLKKILRARFPGEGYDEMISVQGIKVFGICPHHLLPVEMECTVSYIPKKDVLGISKLARLVKLMASRPVLQEKMTVDITETLMKELKPKGAAAFIKGRHFCMIMRGVRQEDAVTITSSLKGVFFSEHAARQEFFTLTRGNHG